MPTSRPTGRTPRLVLLGGGHSHLRVLESLRIDDWPRVDVILVSPAPREFYSGMVPGYLQGSYCERQLSLPIGALAHRADVRFIPGRALRVDAVEQRVYTEDLAIDYDFLSLDIGSVPGGFERPGVKSHAFSLRPLQRAMGLRRRVEQLGRAGGRLDVAVVGAGAGGVEVALALQRRVRECGADPRLTLLDRGTKILPGYSDKMRDRAGAILERREVVLELREDAVSVSADGLRLASGGEKASQLVVWCTGAAPPPLLSDSDLPLSARGYLAVGPTLRVRDGSPIWGGGDCIDLQDLNLPKAGVYAVREGPVLAHNLRAAIAGRPERIYTPQDTFLSILNTADGRGLLRWKRVVSHSRVAWWLKDRIDRRFMSRYRC